MHSQTCKRGCCVCVYTLHTAYYKRTHKHTNTHIHLSRAPKSLSPERPSFKAIWQLLPGETKTCCVAASPSVTSVLLYTIKFFFAVLYNDISLIGPIPLPLPPRDTADTFRTWHVCHPASFPISLWVY